MKTIQPSLLAFDKPTIQKQIELCHHLEVQVIHYDVMDGLYVPNKAFEHEYLDLIVQNQIQPFIHLMTKNVIEHVKQYLKYSVQAIAIHPDADIADHIHAAINLIKQHPTIEPALAVRNTNDLKALIPYLKKVKYVVMMGVVPGAGGQKYMPQTTKQLQILKELIQQHNWNIEVILDGGVTTEILQEVQPYVDHFVSGSFLMNSPNIQTTYNHLIDELKK